MRASGGTGWVAASAASTSRYFWRPVRATVGVLPSSVPKAGGCVVTVRPPGRVQTRPPSASRCSAPARGLVGQPVVVFAQAGEVVVRGRPVRVRGLVVEVAAAGAGAAAGEAAASIAQGDEAVEGVGGAVGRGAAPVVRAHGRRWRRCAVRCCRSAPAARRTAGRPPRCGVARRARCRSAVGCPAGGSAPPATGSVGRPVARRRRSATPRRRPAPPPAARRGPPRHRRVDRLGRGVRAWLVVGVGGCGIRSAGSGVGSRPSV